MTDLSRVAAVIVTYNSADVLGDCLRSLSEQETPLAAVVVVDNASRDTSRAVAENFAGCHVRVVELGCNAGYSAGINAGIAALELTLLDAILVLNPDCRVRPGALSKLASVLDRPGRGIAVPSLFLPDGSQQRSLFRKPTVGRALVEGLLPVGVARRLGLRGEQVADPKVYERPGVTPWATGAAMLISVSALREVGPWDESFLLYSDETEYCLRAADKGWQTWYEPAAVFEHMSGASGGGDSGVNPTLAALLTVNRVTLFQRRHNRLQSAAFFAAVAVGESLRAIAGRRTARASIVALVRPSRREEVRAEFIRGVRGARELAT